VEVVASRSYEHEFAEKVIALIPDIERRSSLQLRTLIKYPLVKSRCCKTSHCFRCKIRGGHNGRTCEEYQATISSEIRFCPSCNTAIVKGDGCNSITCVCSHNFNWATAATVAAFS
jgi:hypothetical protein